MAIKLIANIEHHEGAGYVAWIDSMKGMVVQADTLSDVCKELFISLNVKLAYTLGISAAEIEEITEQKDYKELALLPNLQLQLRFI